MATAKVTFRKCLQDSQELGSDDEHMVSRVFYDLEIGGNTYREQYVDIKQTVGSKFEGGPLEVGHGQPQGYSGPFNYNAFRDAVESYYRSLVGAQGHGIRAVGGSMIRMRDNTFVVERAVQFEVEGE